MGEVLTETSLREIDARVAALIEPMPPLAHCRSMHDTVSPLGAWVHTHIHEHGDECEVVPRVFSSDIALALKVVEKMQANGWESRIGTHSYGPRWMVEMFETNDNLTRRETAQSDSLPEAICRAALKAVGAE